MSLNGSVLGDTLLVKDELKWDAPRERQADGDIREDYDSVVGVLGSADLAWVDLKTLNFPMVVDILQDCL